MDIIYKISFILGGLSLLVFFLGNLKMFAPLYILFLIALGLIGISWVTLPLLSLTRSSQKVKGLKNFQDYLSQSSYKDHLLIGFLFILILAISPLALTPPASRDELIQHLALPKLYLEKGRIFEIPFLGFSYLPINIDLLYFIPLSFGNDIIPKLIHFSFTILTGMIIYSYLFPQTGRCYALLGFLLYFSTPLVVNLSKTAYTDLGMNLYSTLALIGIIKWREANFKNKWLIYSAISMGFALSSKPTAIPNLVLFPMAVVYFYSRGTKKQGQALKLGAIYLLIILIILSPWLIRNYLWADNFLYPLYGGYGGIRNTTADYISIGISPVQKRLLLYNESALDILLVPLRIFIEGKDDSPQYFDGVLNPFFPLFLLFGFIKKPKNEIKYLAIFSFLFFYITFFTAHLVTRYLLPVLPALIIIMIWGVKNGLEDRRLRAITIIFSALLFLFNLVYIFGLYQRDKPLPYLLGKETRKEYLARILPDYPAINFANNTLPMDVRVMFLFTGDRGYYWDREYYCIDRGGLSLAKAVKESLTEEELLEKFKSFKVTHLFIKNSIFLRFLKDNFKEDKLVLINRFFKTKLSMIYNDNNYSIFSLKIS